MMLTDVEPKDPKDWHEKVVDWWALVLWAELVFFED